MIVLGTPQMIPALSRIWAACFGDSPEYIRFFMKRRFSTCRPLVWLEEGEPVGVAYLLPCKLGCRPAYYGYAIGVRPDMRRRGICEALLYQAEHICRQEGAVFFLMPRPGLEDYYYRRGFQPAFYSCIYSFWPACPECGCLDIREAGGEEYSRLRDRYFQGNGYVCWNGSAVAYALEEQRLCGGFANILSWQGGQYLLFGRIEGETLSLRETTIPLDLMQTLASRLCGYYHVSALTLEYPSPCVGEGTPRGSCYGFTPDESGWLALDLT